MGGESTKKIPVTPSPTESILGSCLKIRVAAFKMYNAYRHHCKHSLELGVISLRHELGQTTPLPHLLFCEPSFIQEMIPQKRQGRLSMGLITLRPKLMLSWPTACWWWDLYVSTIQRFRLIITTCHLLLDISSPLS
jgi:hypothetical protein